MNGILIRAGAAVMIGGVLALIGYNVYDYATAPETGEIVDRSFTDDYTTTSQTCTGTGASRTCTPHTTYHPERHVLVLREGENEGPRNVDEDEYERCHVGDLYPKCARVDV